MHKKVYSSCLCKQLKNKQTGHCQYRGKWWCPSQGIKVTLGIAYYSVILPQYPHPFAFCLGFYYRFFCHIRDSTYDSGLLQNGYTDTGLDGVQKKCLTWNQCFNSHNLGATNMLPDLSARHCTTAIHITSLSDEILMVSSKKFTHANTEQSMSTKLLDAYYLDLSLRVSINSFHHIFYWSDVFNRQ